MATQRQKENCRLCRQKENFAFYHEYDDMWEMFRAVIRNSSWGTSEFGGPVWILDFSLENLRKLFPDNVWLEIMEDERARGLTEYGTIKSDALHNFCKWFQWRAEAFVQQLGLGNVLLKYEPHGIADQNAAISFYGYGIFLTMLRSLIGGSVYTPSQDAMEQEDFSESEAKIIREYTFFTHTDGGFAESFPQGSDPSFHDYKESPTHGKCYLLEHFSLTKGYVIPETQPEKIITLVVNDLMECRAQGYGKGVDRNGNTCPYPQMKFDTYLDVKRPCNQHFLPTSDVFCWKRKDGKVEEISVEFPEIATEHGEFWHRQFPLKQNWRELPEE